MNGICNTECEITEVLADMLIVHPRITYGLWPNGVLVRVDYSYTFWTLETHSFYLDSFTSNLQLPLYRPGHTQSYILSVPDKP